MRTNRIVAAAVGTIAGLGFTTAHATNGYQLIGVGAYQKGMGGAVTANPQSAMTAISNPAGVAAIGNRADFSAEAFMPSRTADFSDIQGGTKEDSEADLYAIPALGWAAPVSEGSDFYFGGGMYGTSGLGVDYGQTKFGGNPLTSPPGNELHFDGYSSIQFWQMAPTLAWKANDNLKVGASLNLDYQAVSFQQSIVDEDGKPAMDFNLARTAQAYGYGVTVGALYEINSMIQVGANYKSKQNFNDLEYQLKGDDISGFPNGGGGTVNAEGGTYKMGLDYPQQLAVGVKVDPIDRLRVSADVKWINWSDTMDDLAVTGDFTVNGAQPGPAEAALDPGWDDQIVYALGADYEVLPNKLRVRAGYNYAESPIDSEDVFSNILLPAMTEQHFSLGATYFVNDHWDVSFAYMKAFNNSETGKGDVPESYSAAPPNGFGEDSNAKIDLEETTYSLNIGYRF